MKCLLFHRWSVWGNVLPVDMSEGDTVLVQWRYCHKCRKAEIRRAA